MAKKKLFHEIFMLGFALVVPCIALAADYIEIQKIAPPDLAPTDQFGEHLAIDGDTIVAASDEWLSNTGSVYVFERNVGGPSEWGLTAKILDPTPQAGDNFGYDVDVDGDRMITGSETAYLYERVSQGSWVIVAEFTEATIGKGSLRIDGDTAIGGRTTLDTVFVHERNAGGPDAWGLTAELKPSEGDPQSFGWEVDIDGDYVVAGAWGDDELADDAGSAYIWERDVFGNWQEDEVVKLFASDGEEGAEFGESVAIEGDTVVVGARRHAKTGAAYVYRRDETGSWLEIAKLVADDAEIGDSAGQSVAISQGRVTVGASSRDRGDLDAVGTVFVFEEDANGTWTQIAELRASDEGDLYEFGAEVAAAGGTVVGGAYLDDEHGLNAGASFVFQAVASPEIELAGRCPGLMDITLAGATPGGSVAFVASNSEGQTVIPAGPCAGIEVDLESAQVLSRMLVDGEGEAEFSRLAGPNWCGSFLQVVDVVTCGVGPSRQLSE